MLALTRWSMGVLTPVIEIAALTMLHALEYLALRRAIALQFITPSLSILPQGEQFPMVIAFLMYYVATIELAYISIFP